MIVKRINDELYHHGVKGQRWGHRKQRYGDIRDTGGSRPKNTTGNSKGVHRRTNENGDTLFATGKATSNNLMGYSDHVGGSNSIYRRQMNPKTAIRDKRNISVNNTNSTGNASGISGYGESKDDLEKEKRSAQYKDEAIALRLQNEERIKNSKKFLSKLKLFGEAYTEVHSENIEKGVNFIKKLFKRK